METVRPGNDSMPEGNHYLSLRIRGDANEAETAQ